LQTWHPVFHPGFTTGLSATRDREPLGREGLYQGWQQSLQDFLRHDLHHLQNACAALFKTAVFLSAARLVTEEIDLHRWNVLTDGEL